MWRACDEFNVKSLLPYHRRPRANGLGFAPGPPPPVPGPDGRLKLKALWGRPYVLAHWAGCNALCDTWEPLDNLTNCAEATAAFGRASGCPLRLP